MRHASLMFVGIAAAVISVSPASATMRITGDPGGLVIDYVERFEAARASGEPVIIDGACLSACTLAIGILPRGQVCATPNAVLGFHATWRPTANGGRVTSPAATQARPDYASPSPSPPTAAGAFHCVENVPTLNREPAPPRHECTIRATCFWELTRHEFRPPFYALQELRGRGNGVRYPGRPRRAGIDT